MIFPFLVNWNVGKLAGAGSVVLDFEVRAMC